ncbi:MAG: FtsW/RodA/SpoVE family cell cycle protein, partial [Verrucomicrobiaceae bacterium]
MLAKRSVLLLSLSVITLLVIGFVMLASASFYTAKGQVDDYRMVIRQGVSLLASLGVCMLLAMMNYERLLRWRWYFFGIAVITLILCYVPSVGVEKNGARRWIGLQSLGMEGARMQPSEFAKMVLVIV